MWRWRAVVSELLLLVPCVCAGCKSSIVGAEFEGDALYTQSNLKLRELNGYDADAVSAPRMAMFWNPDGITADPADGLEQVGSSRPVPKSAGPWSLFEAPDPALWAHSEGGGAYAIGRLRAYDDRDGNKVQSADEPFIGDTVAGLLYVPMDLDAQQSPFGRPLPKGMHRVEFPVACGAGPVGDMDCGTELGAECRSSDQCLPSGTCMSSIGRQWAHGVCGHKYDPADACVPEGGALFPIPDSDDVYFIKRCDAPSACRTTMNEYCDFGIGACFTGGELALILGGTGPATLCREPTLPEAG